MIPANAHSGTSIFPGKERDTETGLDYFMARYFSSAQGRFTSPDPLLASARLTDPQTWNRYAYVRNDPVNMIDPDGRMTSEIQYAMMMGMALPFVNGVSGSQNFADTAFSGYMRSQEIFNWNQGRPTRFQILAMKEGSVRVMFESELFLIYRE